MIAAAVAVTRASSRPNNGRDSLGDSGYLQYRPQRHMGKAVMRAMTLLEGRGNSNENACKANYVTRFRELRITELTILLTSSDTHELSYLSS